MGKDDKTNRQGKLLLRWGQPLEVAVEAANKIVVPENAKRAGLVITNDGLVNVYLAIGHAAEVDKGIFLAASGGSYEINDTNLTTQAISGFGAAAGAHLTYQEAV